MEQSLWRFLSQRDWLTRLSLSWPTQYRNKPIISSSYKKTMHHTADIGMYNSFQMEEMGNNKEEKFLHVLISPFPFPIFLFLVLSFVCPISGVCISVPMIETSKVKSYEYDCAYKKKTKIASAT